MKEDGKKTWFGLGLAKKGCKKSLPSHKEKMSYSTKAGSICMRNGIDFCEVAWWSRFRAYFSGERSEVKTVLLHEVSNGVLIIDLKSLLLTFLAFNSFLTRQRVAKKSGNLLQMSSTSSRESSLLDHDYCNTKRAYFIYIKEEGFLIELCT